MRDLRQSKLTYNEECVWWTRDERDKFVSSELVMKRNASGTFNAKEVNAENYQNNIVGGSFMFDKTTITLKTPDNINGIKQNDIVLFRGETWMVETAQRKKAKAQNSCFLKSDNCAHFWYLELRK